MGELDQAARDLVDSANAGDENAMATLFLVGENCRTGRMKGGQPTPFRAFVVHELAMRYALSCVPTSTDYASLSGDPEPRELPAAGYAWIWRTVSRCDPGKRPELFATVKSCAAGKEAAVTAFSLGPRLTDGQLRRILQSFGDDSVGRALARRGMDDPHERGLAPILEEVGESDVPVVEGPYFLGACLLLARVRQALVSGNFAVEPDVAWELGHPTKRECRERIR